MSIALAWFIDLRLGEPPAPLHPVVWMGNYLRAVRRRLPPTLLAGALAWLGGALLTVGLALLTEWLIYHAVRLLPFATLQMPVMWLLFACALKPLFAWRALYRAGLAVTHAPDLVEARRLLAWHLVSRDTTTLDAGEVAGATIESLTENLSDSLVAPLCYFVVGGLPLAALYRYVNTADAMWGYRTPALERFGKVAARVDDLLNLIPARLTALLLCGTAAFCGLSSRRAWQIGRRDGGNTPSPNAGRPMSVAAGALGVRLDKQGVYVLGAEFPAPTQADAQRALHWVASTAWLSMLLLTLLSVTLGTVLQ